MSHNQKLPEFGFVRLKSILGPIGPIPVSKSTWWAGVISGQFPQPVKLGQRITAWRVEDIRSLVEKYDVKPAPSDLPRVSLTKTRSGHRG